jgi:hypothetical protein
MKKLLLAFLLPTPLPASAQNAVTPIVSASAENSHVLKTTPGRLIEIYASNVTATAGFLLVLNATAVPADGAVTPLDCFALPASGTVRMFWDTRAHAYNTGVTAVLTSATTCFTKTTGVITGFISGMVE